MSQSATAVRGGLVISDVVQSLGVGVISVGERETRGYCPVHAEIKGRPDQKGKWYINNTTGLWHCFSCHAGGSLPYLVELLGGEYDDIAELMIVASDFESVAAEIRGEVAETEPEEEAVYISERLYNKHSRPSERMMNRRDLDRDVVQKLNIRWDLEKSCWLLPVYDFGFKLLGWQEKSNGYFNNHPEGLTKRHSLFGFQGCGTNNTLVVVESPLDAARFQRYGQDAVAIYGSYASNEQLDAIVTKLRPSVTILAFDNDEAGDDANATVYRRLSSLGLSELPRFFRYPRGTRNQDPGDLSSDQLRLGVENPWPDMPSRVYDAYMADQAAHRSKLATSATSNGRRPSAIGGRAPRGSARTSSRSTQRRWR